jgi:predicted nuclease of predicted toxin-antitoxin system
MRLLLDEHLPVGLKEMLNPHQVFSVKDMGWAGKKNGELMKLIAQNEFDVFLTADKNLPFQQNLNNLACGLWVLDCPTTKYSDLIRFIPVVLKEISLIPQSQKPECVLRYIFVDGLSNKKKIYKFQS